MNILQIIRGRENNYIKEKLTDLNHIYNHQDLIPEIYSVELYNIPTEITERNHSVTTESQIRSMNDTSAEHSIIIYIFDDGKIIWENAIESQARHELFDNFNTFDFTDYKFGYISGTFGPWIQSGMASSSNIQGYIFWQTLNFND